MKKNISYLAILILCGTIFISCSKKPADVVKEFETAFNSHNITALISLFNKDAEIDLSVLNKIKGLDQIKGFAEYDSTLNSQITLSDITENDGKAYFVMSLSNDFLKSIGINEARYSMIFKISGGKIENISGSTTNETDVKIREFQNPFMLWAAREHLDILNSIMPNGNIIFNSENAKKYLDLVIEWRKSLQTTIEAPK